MQYFFELKTKTAKFSSAPLSLCNNYGIPYTLEKTPTTTSLEHNMTFGFEMTGIPLWYVEGVCNYGASYAIKLLAREIQGNIKENYPTADSKKDGHCVEVNSPVFSSWDEAKKFYDYIKEYFDSQHISPHNPTCVCGGNHLHFGNLSDKQREQCALHLIDYPFIPWIFTQPDDTESCCNITNNNNYRTLNSKRCLVTTSSWYDNRKTLEYRCVEAPLDIDEFKDQFDFFYALTLHSLKSQVFRPFGSLKEKDMKRLTSKDCIYQFKLLLDVLGLTYGRYKKYVIRNLLPRWTLGRKRV